MRLVVTGGAGFLGSHYVRTVLTSPWHEPVPEQVVVFDKLTYAGNLANLAAVRDDPRLTVVRGDVVDRPLVDRVMASADAVVHFAAESHVDRSIRGARDFVVTNVVGTQTLLESVSVAGVDRFVQVSTDEVYGSVTDGSWEESQPLAPRSPYSASKAAGDLLALAYASTHGTPVTVARCPNTYGPYQLPEKVVPLFATNLIEGATVPLYGDGSNVREWLHVDDTCRALHLLLARGRAGEVYNVGGGTELSNRLLTDRMLSFFGAGEERIALVADRPGHDFRYSMSGRKLREELGFGPLVGFEAGLAATLQWYVDHPEWWRPLKRRG